MNNIPRFSTHTTKEVLDYYWELYDKLKAAQKQGSIDEAISKEEEQWFIEMTKFIEWKMDNTSG